AAALARGRGVPYPGAGPVARPRRSGTPGPAAESVVMELITPFWFKQRQLKAEAAGTDLYRLTGPNLKEAFVGIRRGANDRWAAFLRDAADGPDVAATEPRFETAYDAWEAAFELFREKVII